MFANVLGCIAGTTVLQNDRAVFVQDDEFHQEVKHHLLTAVIFVASCIISVATIFTGSSCQHHPRYPLHVLIQGGVAGHCTKPFNKPFDLGMAEPKIASSGCVKAIYACPALKVATPCV